MVEKCLEIISASGNTPAGSMAAFIFLEREFRTQRVRNLEHPVRQNMRDWSHTVWPIRREKKRRTEIVHASRGRSNPPDFPTHRSEIHRVYRFPAP